MLLIFVLGAGLTYMFGRMVRDTRQGWALFAAMSVMYKGGYWNAPGPATANLNNAGPHGFSEILYAYSSGAGNNGSAFAGISANTPWYAITLGLDMLLARFLFIIPVLAIAGSLASKKLIPVTSGTFSTILFPFWS